MEALVAKRLVEVAEVEVELVAVKFCRVLEAFTNKLAEVRRPVEVMELVVKRPLASIERAETVEVAPVAVVEVAR